MVGVVGDDHVSIGTGVDYLQIVRDASSSSLLRCAWNSLHQAIDDADPAAQRRRFIGLASKFNSNYSPIEFFAGKT
jgi:hypothetical protein